MLTKAQNAFENRVHAMGRQGQLYIVPTLDGLKLLALNLILLIMGLVYANNFVLLFNFILFCLFIGSMYYTHFNLQGLKIISSRINPLHAGETGLFSLQLKSRSALGHHYLNVKMKNDFLQVSDKDFHFSMKEKVESQKIEIPVTALKRGMFILNRITIETKFPFHLFRAFTCIDLNATVTVYPEKQKLDLHSTYSFAEEKNGSEDEFYLRNFTQGDSLKRILWKKYAQTGKLITKQTISESELPVILTFSSNELTKAEVEKELSSICFGLHELHSQNIPYGLDLHQLSAPPGLSYQHLSNCLKALAGYES